MTKIIMDNQTIDIVLEATKNVELNLDSKIDELRKQLKNNKLDLDQKVRIKKELELLLAKRSIL